MAQEAPETIGREIAEAEQRGITVSQRMQLLREVLTNPNCQPQAAKEMAELMFKLEDRDARAAFIEAKVRAISEMPAIGKGGQNTHTDTRYAKWETIQPIITQVLTRHGLVLNFDIGHENGKVTVAPILSGHGWEERGGAMAMPSDVGKGRNDVQAVASSVSYGKRTTAKAMLNLIERGVIEDDDGNAGGGTPEDHMSPAQRALIDAGRSAAYNGSVAYENWFKSLSAAEKGWLAYEPYHGQNKEAAAKFDESTPE